jgi:hypothetical protein
MVNFKNQVTSPTHLLLAIALFLGNMALIWTAAPIQASSFEKFTAVANKQNEEEVPGRVRGGARRGNCPATEVPLTALVPFYEDTRQSPSVTYVGGLTTADRPTFWFYVPYKLDSMLTAEFILQEADKDVYRVSSTAFPAAETSPGIISVTLPASVAPLEIGKTYQWYFKVNCTAETPVFVQGGVKRIALDPAVVNQIAAVSPQEQVALYRANRIWYDSITVLGNLRRMNSTNAAIAEDWTLLLKSIGLNDIPAP